MPAEVAREYEYLQYSWIIFLHCVDISDTFSGQTPFATRL